MSGQGARNVVKVDGVDRLVGERLATARRRRGLSQLQFADMIGRSESWVSKVETGVLTLDSLTLAGSIAELLGISFTYLVALDARTGDKVPPPEQAGSLELKHLLIGPRDVEMWDDAKRRWFFTQTAATVGCVLDVLRLQPGQDLSDRVQGVRAGRAHLDAEVLDGLEQTTLGCRRVYRSVSAFSLLGPAHGALTLLIELAADAGNHRDRVVSMIGQMGALVGSMLMLDLGDFSSAKHYLAIATRAAQQIDDPELIAFALGCRAFHAGYGDSPSAGLGFAEAGLDIGKRGIHPATHGWLRAVASEMYAATGAAKSFEQSLDTAAGYLREPTSHSWVGIGVFNHAKLTAYRGGGLMRLGRYGDAQAELLAALERLDPALRKHRCTAHIDLAEAYLRDGKIDEGAKHAINALDIIADTKHAESTRRVKHLYRTLRPVRTEAIRRLGHRLIALEART